MNLIISYFSDCPLITDNMNKLNIFTPCVCHRCSKESDRKRDLVLGVHIPALLTPCVPYKQISFVFLFFF